MSVCIVERNFVKCHSNGVNTLVLDATALMSLVSGSGLGQNTVPGEITVMFWLSHCTIYKQVAWVVLSIITVEGYILVVRGFPLPVVGCAPPWEWVPTCCEGFSLAWSWVALHHEQWKGCRLGFPLGGAHHRNSVKVVQVCSEGFSPAWSGAHHHNSVEGVQVCSKGFSPALEWVMVDWVYTHNEVRLDSSTPSLPTTHTATWCHTLDSSKVQTVPIQISLQKQDIENCSPFLCHSIPSSGHSGGQPRSRSDHSPHSGRVPSRTQVRETV